MLFRSREGSGAGETDAFPASEFPLGRRYELRDRFVGTLLVDPALAGPGRDAFFGVRGDRRVFEQALSFLAAGDLVVDVGSNFGGTSRLFAERVGPTGSVHSFEPNPATFELLAENCRLAPHGNVEAHPVALGAAPGEATLFFPAEGNTGMVNLTGAGEAIGRASVETLDSLGLTPSLLKIDAEGQDGDVLAGGRETTRRMSGRRSLILVEANWEAGADTLAAELEQLESEGFVAYLDDRKRLRPWSGERVAGNLLLVANATL